MAKTGTYAGGTLGGTAPQGRYYKRPEFGKDAEKLQYEAHYAKVQLEIQQEQARKKREETENLRRQAEVYKQQLENGTAGTREYEQNHRMYLSSYAKSRMAAYRADQSVREMEPYQRDYQTRMESLDRYTRQQRSEYEKWKSTIRDPVIVKGERDQIESSLRKLERQRAGLQNMNIRMAGSVGYAGSIAAMQGGGDYQRQIDANMEKLKHLNQQIVHMSRSRDLLSEEAEWGEYYQYADLREQPDFLPNSKYESTANGRKPMRTLGEGPMLETGFDDPLYDYINRNTAAELAIRENSPYMGNKDHIAQMDDDEIATFNYLYKTQGQDQAYRYITYLEKDLNYRQRKEDQQMWQEMADEAPVAASAFSVLTAPAKGLSYMAQAADLAINGKVDENAAYNRISNMNRDIREKVSEKIQGRWGNVGSFAYMTGMSMADFIFDTAISGGNRALPLAIMGSGAAADTTISAKERGLDDKQAFTLGTIAGLAEVATEKVSIDSLLDANMLKDGVLKYIGKNILAEGSEEAASDLINMYADILVAKDKSEWKQSINAYKKQGLTEQEAFARAVADQALSMGVDALGGAISGGIMAGANAGRYKMSEAISGHGHNGSKPKLFERFSGGKKQLDQAAKDMTNPIVTGAMPTVDEETRQRKILNAETIAEKSGYQFHAAEESIQQAVRLSKVIGKDIFFYDEAAGENGIENGYYDPDTDKIYINARSQNPTAQIIGHELTHSTEIADVYESLSNLVMERIERTGGDLKQMRQETARLYEANGKNLDDAQVDREIVAQYVEKHLLTDEQAIMEMAHRNRSVVQVIKEWFDRFLAKLGNRKAQERIFITNARDIYAKALQQADSVRRDHSLEQEKQSAYAAGNEEYGDALFNEQWDQPGYVERLLEQDPYDLRLHDEKIPAAGGSGEDGMQYSIKRTSSMPYSDQLKQIEQAKMNGSNSLYVGLPSEQLRTAGLSDAPFAMNQADYRKSRRKTAKNKKYSSHNVPYDFFVNLQQNLADAPMMIDNGEKLTIVTAYKMQDTKGKGSYVVAGVWKDNQMEDYTVNQIKSVYPWDDFAERIKTSAEQGSLITVNKNKAEQMLATIGIQPSEVSRIISLAKDRVSQKVSGVKPKFSISQTNQQERNEIVQEFFQEREDGILASAQNDRWIKNNSKTVDMILKKRGQLRTDAFREWFGASKVVTAAHEPAVVFHGTKSKFYEFNTDGKPMWFGIRPWYSMHYAQDQGPIARHLPGTAIYAGGEQKVIPAYIRAEAPMELGTTDGRFEEMASHLARRAGIPEKALWSIWDQLGQPDEAWKVINSAQMVRLAKQYGFDSIHAEEDGNQTWAVFDSSQIKSAVANKGTFDRNRGDIRYSVSENAEAEDGAAPTELPTAENDTDLADRLPAKAADYVSRTQRTLLAKISDTMSVPRKAGREKLMPVIRKITNEYLHNGTISDEVRSQLFEEAYAAGVEVDTEFYDQYKEVKDHLRTTAVTLSQQDQSNIADYNEFRKTAFGTLRIVKSGGIPVDSLWLHLQDMAPSLFPDSITHPADQLVHMYEVARSIQKTERTLDEYYGPDAQMYKKFARNEFDAAISDAIINMRDVVRYMDDRVQSEKIETELTQEEVTDLYPILKENRRVYEKIKAKHLLTEEDTRQVSRLMRGDIQPEHLDQEKDNVKGILAVYEAKMEYEKIAKQIRSWNRAQKAKFKQEADQITKTANLWKDKSKGILYQRETMERNVRDIITDQSVAEKVIETYIKPVHDAQAAATRMKNAYRDRVRELDISRKVAEGNKVSEAHAVQLVGEAADNIRLMQNSKGRIKYRDGKTLNDWKKTVRELWKDNPNLDQKKIYDAVDQFRKIYDELFKQMNEVRIKNGYEPVNYRSGYFPHFQAEGRDGVMALFGKALGIDTEVTALPTTINGITHTFKPGIQWFGNALERQGYNTTYDAVEGFDKYIEGVADVIHQTENIQKLRAFANQLRYRTSEPGIQKQVDEVRAREDLSDTDKELRIKEIYEKGKFELSNFVVELDEYTNLLANKKSRDDRNMEQKIGRDMYNAVKAVESRVAANMVAVNPASWLTNFVPLSQGWAALDSKHLLRGMYDTLKAYKADDGMVDMSSFLTNRRGSDPLVQTWQQGASATLSKPMEWIDNYTSEALVRARYQQNIDRGFSEAEAISEADSWTAGLMADRSKGSMPTLFEQRNPLTKLFTQFQLEVNNQLSWIFKDVPREMKDKGMKMLVAALAKFMLGAWLYNEVYEYFIGRRPALDPIGMLNDTVGDAAGYKLPNLLELGKDLITGQQPDFTTEKKKPNEVVTNLGKGIAEELPFVGGLLGGGRIPISSALPNMGNLVKAATDSEWSRKKKLYTAAKELGKPATYLIPPFGGGQLKKIYEGLNAVIRKGSYSVDAEGNDLLQYPVFTDTPYQFAKNFTQAAIFGKTSLQTGREWIENGFGNMTADQTACYKAMMEVGVSGEDAHGLVDQLRKAQKTEDKSADEVKREILKSSEVSGDGKAVAYYTLLANDKERGLMQQLAETEIDSALEVNLLIDLKDADSESDKLRMIADQPLSDRETLILAGMVMGDKMETDKGNPTQYAQMIEASKKGISADDVLSMQAKEIDLGDFLQLRESGVSAKEARNYLEDIKDLEPEEGKEKVSDIQKWRTAINSAVTATGQLSLLAAVMDDKIYQKVKLGYDLGIEPAVYVRVKEVLPQYDENGNGSYSNAEITAAIRAISSENLMLPGGDKTRFNLTSQQQGILWQLCTGSKSTKNNPFDAAAGQRYLEAKNAQ